MRLKHAWGFLWPPTEVCFCEQCRNGASYSGAVISPNLETTQIFRVPQAATMSDCASACCNLSQCDLAWMLERHCYIVNCQHKENCEPKKMQTMSSHLIFVLRPPDRLLPFAGYGAIGASRGRAAGIQADPAGDVGNLKGLSLLTKYHNPEELNDYNDDYVDHEQDPILPSTKQDWKESLDYADWFPSSSEKSFNLSEADPRGRNVHSAEVQKKETKWEQVMVKNGSELAAVTLPAEKLLSYTMSKLPFGTVPPSANDLQPQPVKANGSFLEEVLRSSNNQSQSTEIRPTGAKMLKNLQGDLSIPQSSTVTALSSSAPTPPSTAAREISTYTATAPAVKPLVVSVGGDIQIMLPKNEVELNSFVLPAPAAETSYNYEWNLISHPADYEGEMESKHSRTMKLSQLSAGLYVFKVAVSGDNAFGEGLVNVTVKPAARVNQSPVAVASPKIQEVSLLTASTFIDGGQSTDDDKIVSYHWDELSGPLREQKVTADTPVLHFSNLVPGNYTFRLTVIDSDGATDSTTASLSVYKPVDHPPIANAGPNQAIQLPENAITLNGNQSSDDHQIVSYEWSLHPNSKSKVVEMQGVRSPYLQLASMQEGDYTFLLTVTDSERQQSRAQVTVIVQPENNRAPVAVAGPDKELIFPMESTILDGSRSTDDQGIVSYHWEKISGPPMVKIENSEKAVAIVTGLQVGAYHFRLTVKDTQGLSSTNTIAVTVREERNSPPKAYAGGSHIIVLPNNSMVIDGSKSSDDQGVVSYLWIRDGQSPAAGDVMHNSDHDAVLQLTNLVEGVYIFHLKVTDARGDSDIDTATVEVRPDPKKNNLVELILEVGVGQLTEQQKDTLVRQLAVLLNVLDSDIRLQRIHAHSDLSTMIVFYVQNHDPSKIMKAAEVVKILQNQLVKEKADFLIYEVLRVDTTVCLLKCSGHGHCDAITKRCICYPFWMESLIQRYLYAGESNCEWSVLYVTVSGFVLAVLVVGLVWTCVCCCKSRKRTKIRKKTKYTILDNIDDQERMELRPKYGIKHRSTEHNSSLMISESEFESDQDTIFSREKVERENPKSEINGSIQNGSAFNYSPTD
ncbi:dyslexia-associated protein KIAA0319 homolog isoform X4 [Ambystoma mexicanum]|uniref:dyslexia-associated protein KIAA0319 homolog isoform X4 n=1 Tax=Ambystoma mexicanum TaxID=8296 RepID=UPI0037E98838